MQHRENHSTSVQMARPETSQISNARENVETTGSLSMVGWKEAGVAIIKKMVCRCFRKLKTELAYDLVILLLDTK